MRVDNRLLRSEILHYQSRLNSWRRYMLVRSQMCRPGTRAIKPRPRASDELGAMIMLLCANLADHRYFRGYTFKDDLIASATAACLEAIEKFNPVTRTSAFSYLTTTAWRQMRRECQREQKHSHSVLEGSVV